MDRIINMIIRQLMRRLVTKGINLGINKASVARRPGKPQDPETLRAQKLAAKNARRIGRM